MKDLWQIRALMDSGVKLDCAGNPDTPARLALAQANADAWRNSERRKQLAMRIAEQIAAMNKSTKDSLWYAMTVNKV